MAPAAERCAQWERRIAELVRRHADDAGAWEPCTLVFGEGGEEHVANPLALMISDKCRVMLTNGGTRRIKLPPASAGCARALLAYLKRGEFDVDLESVDDVFDAFNLCVEHNLAPLAENIAEKTAGSCASVDDALDLVESAEGFCQWEIGELGLGSVTRLLERLADKVADLCTTVEGALDLVERAGTSTDLQLSVPGATCIARLLHHGWSILFDRSEPGDARVRRDMVASKGGRLLSAAKLRLRRSTTEGAAEQRACEKNVIRVLIALISCETEDVREDSAHQLELLTTPDPYATSVDEGRRSGLIAGGIVPLVGLARNGRPRAQAHAAATLASLTVTRAGDVWDGGGGPGWCVALVDRGTPYAKERAAEALRHLVAYAVALQQPGNPDRLVSQTIVPLVNFLARGDAGPDPASCLVRARAHVADTLRCLVHPSASDRDDNKAAIVRAGGIAPLVALANPETRPAGNRLARECAAQCLTDLVVAPDGPIVAHRNAVLNAGGVTALVNLVRLHPAPGRSREREYGAAALCNLALNLQAEAIRDREGVRAHAMGLAPHLVDFLRRDQDASTAVRRYVVAALHNLAITSRECREAIRAAGGIDASLWNALATATATERGRIARMLKYFSLDREGCHEIAGTGGIAHLVEMLSLEDILQTMDPQVVTDAAATLQRVAVFADHKPKFSMTNAISRLVAILNAPVDDRDVGDVILMSATKHVVGTLQNLADIADNRTRMVHEGVIAPLVRIATSPLELGNDAFSREHVACLLQKFSDWYGCEIADAGGIAPLVKMLELDSLETSRTRQHAAAALRELVTPSSDVARRHCDQIVDAGAIALLSARIRVIPTSEPQEAGRFPSAHAVLRHGRGAPSPIRRGEAGGSLAPASGDGAAGYDCAFVMRRLAEAIPARVCAVGGVAELGDALRTCERRAQEFAALLLITLAQNTRHVQYKRYIVFEALNACDTSKCDASSAEFGAMVVRSIALDAETREVIVRSQHHTKLVALAEHEAAEVRYHAVHALKTLGLYDRTTSGSDRASAASSREVRVRGRASVRARGVGRSSARAASKKRKRSGGDEPALLLRTPTVASLPLRDA